MAHSPRDPTRIEEILEYLRRAWVYQPDTRLAQLLVNVAKTGEAMLKLYYMEDNELLIKLKRESEKQAAQYLSKGDTVE